MAITKKDDHWRLDFRIKGANSKRIVKRFPTKGEAERYQRWLITQHDTGQPWNATSDRRTLTDLAVLWHELHGQHLRDGQRTLNKINALATELGNPEGQRLTALDVVKVRAKRAKSGQKPKTLNTQIGYLSAMFNRLERLGVIDYRNPLDKIQAVEVPDRAPFFLSHEQIKILLDACQRSKCEHLHLITRLCLATGCRWGEADTLTRQQLHKGLVTFVKTKGNKTRAVPISAQLSTELEEHNPGSHYFFGEGRTEASFRRAVKAAGIDLPQGQATHVCRHTFASWFMMNGGNILTLQKILGHSDIRQTMIYAHLAPDYLQDAVRLNPLEKKALTARNNVPNINT